MARYRRGVQLVVESWGWNLENNAPCAHGRWTGYGVRLGKMAQSLSLFGEEELFHRLQQFYRTVCCATGAPAIENWVHDSLRERR